MQQPIKIFCSYARNSPEDERVLVKLEKHLTNLVRQDRVEIWHDHKIAPGADIKRETRAHFKAADIILIFLSSEYMHSDDCFNEGKQAVQMDLAGIATVRVLLLRHVEWEGAPFSRCRALPKNGKFVSKWQDKDEAFLDIVQGIKELVQEIINNRSIRETNRIQFGDSLNEINIMTFMPPIDALKVNGQTEDVKLIRQTEELKPNKRTKESRQKKQSPRPRQSEQVFADTSALSELIPVQKRNLPRTRRKSDTRTIAPRSRQAGITSWNRVRREHNHLIKGWPGVFFFSSLAFDVVGLPAATWFWLNSGILFWLALFISLAIFAVRSITPYRLLVIPFAGFYGLLWGFIIRHYVPSWNLAMIIAIGFLVGLVHFLVFR